MDRNEFYGCLARVGKLLESPERLMLLDALCQAERTVEELADATGMPYRSVSHHLRRMDEYGFVRRRKQGRYAVYSVTGPHIMRFLRLVQKLAEDLFPEIPLALSRLKEKRVDSIPAEDPMIIDIRSREEFENGRIPNAVNIPFEDLEKHLEEIPEDRPVLAYCRDEYCELADRAVDMLRKNGRAAWRLKDSVIARRYEDRPVETGKE